MPSWFSKVFQSGNDAPGSENPAPAPEEVAVAESAIEADDPPEAPKPRRVLSAPVLADESETSSYSPEIQIKCKIEEVADTYTFYVDRPVLDGISFWLPDRDTANAASPLAAALFDMGGIESVLIHNLTVTVTGDGTGMRATEDRAREIGAQIRAHLKSEVPVLHPEYIEQMPSEEEIREALQRVLDEEINPGIAAHSGVITLARVEGNTAYITMGGGCQGCAASTITLRQGVESAFRAAAPLMGALLDETDHSAGDNPYFRELPAGMGM